MSSQKDGLGTLAGYGGNSPASSVASPQPRPQPDPIAEPSDSKSHDQGEQQQQQPGEFRIKGSAAAPSAIANGTVPKPQRQPRSWQAGLIQQAAHQAPTKRPEPPQARPGAPSSASLAAQAKPRSSSPSQAATANHKQPVELLTAASAGPSPVEASGSRPKGTGELEMDKGQPESRPRPDYYNSKEEHHEDDASFDRSSRRRARSPVAAAAAEDQPNKRPRQNGSSGRSHRYEDDVDYAYGDHYRQSTSGSSKRQRTYSSRSPSPRSHYLQHSSHESRSHTSRQSPDDWPDHHDRHTSDRRRHSRWDTRPDYRDEDNDRDPPMEAREHSPVQAAHEKVLQQNTSAPAAPTPAPPPASTSQDDPTQSRVMPKPLPSGISIAFPSKAKSQSHESKHHHPLQEFSAAPDAAAPPQPPSHASYAPPAPTSLQRKKRDIHKELSAPKKPITEVQTMPWNEPLLPTAINANINTSAYADAFLSRIPSESRSDSTSSAQRRPLIGTSDMNSTYKKQDQLGEGTFGVVWRGQVIRDFEPTLRSDAWKKAAGLSALVLTSQGQVKRRRVEKGTVVALKQILHHQEFEGMPITSLREIKILKMLDHPNCVSLLDMAHEEGDTSSSDPNKQSLTYMVFPYLDHDLAGLLTKYQLNINEIKLFTAQLFEGTYYLHNNHILHRDMKSANLLINRKGELKIADFGLARPLYTDDPSKKYTGTVVTRWYRPPELLLGERKYSYAVDMWGIGCIIAEMFHRRPFLAGSSDADQAVKIFHLCGKPQSSDWPGWRNLPGMEGVRPDNFPEVNRVHSEFSKYGSQCLPELMDGLFTLSPYTRMTAAQARNHDWLWTRPYPAELGKVRDWEDSKEMDSKKVRDAQVRKDQFVGRSGPHQRPMPPMGGAQGPAQKPAYGQPPHPKRGGAYGTSRSHRPPPPGLVKQSKP